MTDLPGPTADEQAIGNFNPYSREPDTPDQLTRLVRCFGVRDREVEIRRCFDLVCRDSMGSAACRSSLNADGTPLQFALSLARGRTPAFEFVGEPFLESMDYPARRALGLERMTHVAAAMGVQSELNAVRQHLERLADGGSAGDFEDPAGAFWIGASFPPSGEASMTVYANARRGRDELRWRRLSEFTESLAEGDWHPVFAIAKAAALKPLGAGVRVSPRRPPHVRVYFGTYGVKPVDYHHMFWAAGARSEFDHMLALFFEETLGADAAFPTRSAVFSFGSNGDGEWSPKLELCAHCAWNTDRDAEECCQRLLQRLSIDSKIYHDTLRILARPRAFLEVPQVHAFVGVGMRHGEAYLSIYLNPGRGGL